MDKCPVCSKKDNIRIVGLPVVSNEASRLLSETPNVVLCMNCNFYFVSPTINFTTSEWETLYGPGYFAGNSKLWLHQRGKEQKIRIEHLAILNSGINEFLDIGCGEGLALIDALDKGWKVTGVDISDNRCHDARNPKISFVNSDIFTANFDDNSFDCIYMDSVLEHIQNPLKYVNELYRILRKNGVIYIGIPNENSLTSHFRNVILHLMGKGQRSAYIKPFKHPYHINGFTPNSIKKLLAEVGFRSIECMNIAGRFDELIKCRAISKGAVLNTMLLPFNMLTKGTDYYYFLDAFGIK